MTNASQTTWATAANDLINTVVRLEDKVQVDIENLITGFYERREELQREQAETAEGKQYSPLNLNKRVDNGRPEIRWIEIHCSKQNGKPRRHRKYVSKPARNKYHQTTLRNIAKEWEWEMVLETEIQAREIRERIDALGRIRKQALVLAGATVQPPKPGQGGGSAQA